MYMPYMPVKKQKKKSKTEQQQSHGNLDLIFYFLSMGRKIPARKHRSVKDPDVQRRARFSMIKDKINNPPAKGKEDVQEIPKSVFHIMQLKEKAKAWKEKTKIKKKKQPKSKIIGKARFDVAAAFGKEVLQPGMDRPSRHIPKITQRRGENLNKLMSRLHGAAMQMKKEIQFEEEFGVEVKRDEHGKVTEVARVKQEKTSKKSKLREKRKERELKKDSEKEPEKDFIKRDTFEFGDVVHGPPIQLTLPGRKGKEMAGRKPGKSDLLLKHVLNPKIKENKTSKTDKKKLSDLERQKQEIRRQAVVEAFRKSKKARMAL